WIVRPLVLPDMELDQIQGVQSQVLQTGFDTRTNVLGRKYVSEREAAPAGPSAVLGRNFAGDEETLTGMLADQLTEYLLAASLALGQRGIEEIATQINGQPESRPSLLVVTAGPASQAPHAVTNFADLPAQPPKRTVLHRLVPPIHSRHPTNGEQERPHVWLGGEGRGRVNAAEGLGVAAAKQTLELAAQSTAQKPLPVCAAGLRGGRRDTGR